MTPVPAGDVLRSIVDRLRCVIVRYYRSCFVAIFGRVHFPQVQMNRVLMIYGDGTTSSSLAFSAGFPRLLLDDLPPTPSMFQECAPLAHKLQRVMIWRMMMVTFWMLGLLDHCAYMVKLLNPCLSHGILDLRDVRPVDTTCR